MEKNQDMEWRDIVWKLRDEYRAAIGKPGGPKDEEEYELKEMATLVLEYDHTKEALEAIYRTPVEELDVEYIRKKHAMLKKIINESFNELRLSSDAQLMGIEPDDYEPLKAERAVIEELRKEYEAF